MKTVVYFSFPVAGHVNPVLKVLEQARKQGLFGRPSKRPAPVSSTTTRRARSSISTCLPGR